jgi:HEAT repeat protein
VVWSIGKHSGYAYTVGFGRDSRTLLSGGKDGACYLWDLRPEAGPAAADPTRLLDDLISGNSPAAYQAMWAMSDTPERTVALLSGDRLKERLTSLEDADRWIAARRAMSVLTQIGTAQATAVITTWAEQDADVVLRRAATAALNGLSFR